MGKFYARERGDRDWRDGRPRDTSVGINLVDTTTGVFLFMSDGDDYASIRLSPLEARKLAAGLIETAREVEEDNRLG